MSITRFFVDALGSALALGLATPEDVLRHVTPDVLSVHLPRPLWSKLIAACLAAPRTDARLVVETISVANLCEHMPKPILWACLSEIGQRALGKSLLAMPPAPEKVAMGTSPGVPMPAAPPAASHAAPAPVSQPSPAPAPQPAPQPIIAAPSGPTPAPIATPVSSSGPTRVPPRAQTEPPAPLGELPPVGSRSQGSNASRAQTVPMAIATPTPPAATTPSNGLRSSSAGASTRRPQATASPTSAPIAEGTRRGPRTQPPSPRRSLTTNADFDLDTDVSGDWKNKQQAQPDPIVEAVVEDDLVDWAQAEETATGGIDLGADSKLERKR